MSNDNPQKPKQPKGYQPPRQGKPGEERKPSLNRGIGSQGGKKATKPKPSIQPTALPESARPSGVEAYGSSNWRAPTHTPQRPSRQAQAPSPSLFERFPILAQWRDKLVALWRKRFPKKEGDEAAEGDKVDRFAEHKAKASEVKAAWGEKFANAKQKTGEKTSAFFAKVGAWWGQTWTNLKEKLGPPLGRAKEKTSALASTVAAKIGQGISAALGFLGVWGNKGAALAQRTASNVKEKMPELPPASEMVRKIPGVGAGLDAMDAAKSKRAQAAITDVLTQTLSTLVGQGVEVAARLKAEPCGGDYIEAHLANGDAAAWLADATAANAPYLPPILFHRPTDAMRLIAARQRLIQEHPMHWQEGLLQPVMTLTFVLHAQRVPAHLLEQVILYMANIIAIQLDDPEAYQSFLWYTKQAAQVASNEDSSRIARQVLAARSNGTLSQEMHEHVVAGLGQLV